jgi:enoyl-[acyl-carrier protein] reductase I
MRLDRKAGSDADQPPATDPQPATIASAAAVDEKPTAVAKPRVARRLARPTDDCDHTGLLAGKKALVFGVANDHSIAWGIARALHDQGAEVGFSSMASLIKRRVRPLAASIGSTFVEACDVRDDDEIKHVFDRWKAREGNLDILVHAVAFAEKEDLAGHFADTSRGGFHTALDISVYSLIAMAREARPYMEPGSSIITLTYYGAEKVVPHYNVMGVAKAALEASTRYLAADLGPSGIRVNAISAGPVRTLSAHGIAGFKTMYGSFAEVTPLRSHITIEDVAGTAVYLASPLSGKTTGEVIYVDGGFNILGLPVAE